MESSTSDLRSDRTDRLRAVCAGRPERRHRLDLIGRREQWTGWAEDARSRLWSRQLRICDPIGRIGYALFVLAGLSVVIALISLGVASNGPAGLRTRALVYGVVNFGFAIRSDGSATRCLCWPA